MSKVYVLRWKKDNLPFWQDIDDGEKIEINQVADILTEHAAIKVGEPWLKGATSEYHLQKKISELNEELRANFPRI